MQDNRAPHTHRQRRSWTRPALQNGGRRVRGGQTSGMTRSDRLTVVPSARADTREAVRPVPAAVVPCYSPLNGPLERVACVPAQPPAWARKRGQRGTDPWTHQRRRGTGCPELAASRLVYRQAGRARSIVAVSVGPVTTACGRSPLRPAPAPASGDRRSRSSLRSWPGRAPYPDGLSRGSIRSRGPVVMDPSPHERSPAGRPSHCRRGAEPDPARRPAAAGGTASDRRTGPAGHPRHSGSVGAPSPGRSVSTVAFTGPLTAQLDERQYEAGFGPC
jgi:hypothetical protein